MRCECPLAVASVVESSPSAELLRDGDARGDDSTLGIWSLGEPQRHRRLVVYVLLCVAFSWLWVMKGL